ncbi:MAG: phosphodiester glycosidase family protein [Clostridia bacterium]|nr:phosphodiester glycosidase family protein [Clostridia bacterium]
MKKIFILIIVIAIIAVPVYITIKTHQSQSDFYTQLNEFNLLLKERNYQQAKQMYDESSSTLKANYNISLENHADSLLSEAKKLDTTQEALDLLYSFYDTGYDSKTISDEIVYYENLIQSNYIFNEGMQYYQNKEFEKAVECFYDVLTYDDNYETAQKYIRENEEYLSVWAQAKDEGHYGRSPYPNATGSQRNYIFIPYKLNGANCIFKINSSTYDIFAIPIISGENGTEISNINIIGDYMFFLVEQNGLLNDEGGNNIICRMTTDGTDIIKLTDCDYTYLISYQDQFYVISKSKGIVKTDIYFQDEEVLVSSDYEIIEMQMTEEGIFFTTHNSENNMNSQYLYSDGNIELIAQGINMHYYDYGDINIAYYDSNGRYEYMYQEKVTDGAAANSQIYAGDIYKYYGKINDSVILTALGNYQQECIKVRDIVTFRNTYLSENNKISYVPLGICYQEELIVLDSKDGISITAENMRIKHTIEFPNINTNVLNENQQEILKEREYFSETETKISEDEVFIYTDSSIDIRTEKKYFEGYDTMVLVSHIYTDDYRWLSSANKEGAVALSDVSGYTWAVPGQSSLYSGASVVDEAGAYLNADVYVYNSDGMFYVYRKASSVPAEEILSANIEHVFSQGVIIVDNYQITTDASSAGEIAAGRSAIGMVSQGHYVSIVVAGETDINRGLTQYALAKVMKDEGCMNAFSFTCTAPFAAVFNELIYTYIARGNQAYPYNEILYYTKD